MVRDNGREPWSGVAAKYLHFLSHQRHFTCKHHTHQGYTLGTHTYQGYTLGTHTPIRGTHWGDTHSSGVHTGDTHLSGVHTGDTHAHQGYTLGTHTPIRGTHTPIRRCMHALLFHTWTLATTYVRTYNLHTNSPLAKSSLNILSSSICSRHFRSCGWPASGSFADDIWRGQAREMVRRHDTAVHPPLPPIQTKYVVPGTLCLPFTHIYMTHCIAEYTQQLLHSLLAAVCFRVCIPHLQPHQRSEPTTQEGNVAVQQSMKDDHLGRKACHK